jgi:hypothetical protein
MWGSRRVAMRVRPQCSRRHTSVLSFVLAPRRLLQRNQYDENDAPERMKLGTSFLAGSSLAPISNIEFDGDVRSPVLCRQVSDLAEPPSVGRSAQRSVTNGRSASRGRDVPCGFGRWRGPIAPLRCLDAEEEQRAWRCGRVQTRALPTIYRIGLPQARKPPDRTRACIAPGLAKRKNSCTPLSQTPEQ